MKQHISRVVSSCYLLLSVVATASNPSFCWWRSHQASGHGTCAQSTKLLQRCRCTRRSSRVDHQTVAACTERRCSSHHWHKAKWPHHSSSDALTLAVIKITNSLQTVPPGAPHSPNQRPAYMDEMVELTATSSSRYVWPPVCQSSPVPEASAENQVWKASLQSCHLLPGTVSQITFSLSQTPNFSRNFSKLTCLHCHFNSFNYFFVFRNMKCLPVYFVGGQ